jgi:aspartate/tyrosine/aromatic aminotransferase
MSTFAEHTSTSTETTTSNFFEHLPVEPPNPILGIASDCNNDPYPEKINLTIGAYRNEQGKPHVLPCMAEAWERVKIHPQYQHFEYLPQDGLSEFVELSRKFMFGESLLTQKHSQIYSMQTVAGTAAVRLGAEFLLKVSRLHSTTSPTSDRLAIGEIAIPNVTWQNHPAIMNAVGFQIKTYRYLANNGVDFDFQAMIEDLRQLVKGTIVLLHACAHNPSGCDPTPEQWQEIFQVMSEHELIAFFDNAYQGFTSGDSEQDAYAVRLFTQRAEHVPVIVACSFSKNFGLYGERLGALHVVCRDAEQAKRSAAILRAQARVLYSTCPSLGARLVATILADERLKAQWEEDCRAMAQRLGSIRMNLREKLIEHHVKGNWDHIVIQRGMFSYSGIPAEAVDKLRTEHHIYLLRDGRISLAGLNSSNIDRFAHCCALVLGTNN